MSKKIPEIIIITEKPEVGTAICNTLLTKVSRVSKNERCGFFGEKYIWVFDTNGNPFRLQEPQEINPALEKWSDLKSLIPIPDYPKTVPAQKRKTFLDEIKKKCARANEIIMATDADLEGECIGFDISLYSGQLHKTTRVRLTSSLESQDIIEAFQDRKPQAIFKNKYYAAQTKRISDWYWQFLVRAHTTLARRGGMGPALDLSKHNKNQIISSGRVQTIAHSIIYHHYKKRIDHIPITYYKISCQSEYGTIEYVPPIPPADNKHVRLSRRGIRLLADPVSSSDLFHKLSSLNALKIISVDKKEENKFPLNPFDALGLQQVASKIFGWSATKTLKIADKLRLDGHITYVRTDDDKLPISILQSGRLKHRLGLLKALPDIASPIDTALEYMEKYTPKCFTTKEIDHHGIIPSDSIPNLSSLSEDEYNIYELVVRRFIMALLPPLHTINKRFNLGADISDPIGHTFSKFRLSTSEIISEGFTIMKSADRESLNTDNLNAGEDIPVFDWNIEEKHTKPPSPLKLTDLLGQMKRPSILCANESILKELSLARGIGTAATRHQAIDKVLARNYSSQDESGAYNPTEFGMSYSKTLSPQLSDVAITARLEKTLYEIEKAPTPNLAKEGMIKALKNNKEFITKHIEMSIENGKKYE